MENMTIYVNSEIGNCTEFILKGKKQPISMVISPLKVTSGNDILKINSGCNFWKACENNHCQFSQVSYGGPKKS
jgi:hypothetical protein